MAGKNQKKDLTKTNKEDKKARNQGLVFGIVIGLLVLFLLSFFGIIGFIVYFLGWLYTERAFEKKKNVTYFTSYYAIRVGVVVAVLIIAGALFSLGVFTR